MLLETPAPPAPPAQSDARPAPWQSSLQATCECLSWRGSLDNLTRRHAEDDLGETVYGTFPYHTRSALVTAHLLMEQGAFTEEELRAKIEQVRERLNT